MLHVEVVRILNGLQDINFYILAKKMPRANIQLLYNYGEFIE